MGSSYSTWLLPMMLLGIAASLVAIWLLLRGRGEVADASCGRCGYLVVGLPGSICPECGSDLFEVGIRMPRDRPPMPRSLRALTFTLIYAGVMWLILPVIIPMLPHWYSGASSIDMSFPISQQFMNMTAVASGQGWSPVVKFDHVDLTVMPVSGDARSLRIDLRPDASITSVQIARGYDQTITLRDIRDLTPELVLAWMVVCAGPDSQQLRDEAASVSAETIKLASSDQQLQYVTPQRTPFSSLGFRQWPAVGILSRRVLVPLFVVVAIIWMIGVRWVVRKRSAPRSEVLHA